jgi:protein-tyrosine kinase
MSRIYEALQRAEAERQNAPEETPSRAAATWPTAVASLEREELPFRLPDTVEPTTEEPSAAPLFDTSFLAQIPRRTWTLAIDLFPSLQKRGSSVEQFRSLRSRVQEIRGAIKLKTLMISSGLPQEGKSFIATNLAVSLALHRNSKVLLIDGDMRRSTLHHYLGCESKPGLSDFLASRASLAEIMQQADASSTPAEFVSRIANNLTFIPAGDAGDKAADLAGNRKFDELVEALSPHFDWIIVDSSPVIPVSDGVGLARACDGVLLVARSAVTTFPVAQRAQEELRTAKIIGFVLNGVKKPPVLGNYYGYDGSGE